MKGFSLLELIITIIILSILVTISAESFRANRERVLDGEAQANLALLVTAEKDFHRQQGNFLCSNSEAALNSNLSGILLPTLNRNWAYSTICGGTVVCAEAGRLPAPGRTWRKCCSEQQPVLGTCGLAVANCPAGPCL